MNESPGRLSDFLGELKRRNVYRVALTYAVVAFVAVQVADLAGNAFSLPSWFEPMVWVLLGLGHPDRALDWLEQAAEDRSTFLTNLAVHPFFDPLRHRPRFRRLLARMELDTVAASQGP